MSIQNNLLFLTYQQNMGPSNDVITYFLLICWFKISLYVFERWCEAYWLKNVIYTILFVWKKVDTSLVVVFPPPQVSTLNCQSGNGKRTLCQASYLTELIIVIEYTCAVRCTLFTPHSAALPLPYRREVITSRELLK